MEITPQNQKLISRVIYVGLAILGVAYLYLVVMANSDLIEGRHVMFMDEWVTFDGLKRIFRFKSMESFLYFVLDGNDHRYGRIHWYSTALFSAWPYFQWGDQGLIVAQRMFPAVLQLTSFALLVFTYLKTPIYRFAIFVLLLILPNTSYYAHMPKPEPLQLFLLVLFFREILIKKNAGPLAYFLIGLAFGAKFSTLPYLLFVLAAFSFVQENKFSAFMNIGVSFLGLVCAVPILAKGNFRSYASWISSGVTHPADVAGTNFFTWWAFVFNHSIVQSLIFVLVFGLILFLNYKDVKNKTLNLKELLFDPKVQFFICSMSFLLPVMLNVKRLWFMYFHIGTVFLVMWMAVTYENWIMEKVKKQKTILTLLCLCFLLGIGFKYAPIAFKHYRYIAKRTSSKEYKIKIEEYKAITEYLGKVARKEKRQIEVLYSPHMYTPDSTDELNIRESWESVLEWERYPDVIVEYRRHRPSIGLEKMDPNKLEFKDLAKALAMEKRFTTACKEKYCYKELDFKPHRVLIFRRINL